MSRFYNRMVRLWDTETGKCIHRYSNRKVHFLDAFSISTIHNNDLLRSHTVWNFIHTDNIFLFVERRIKKFWLLIQTQVKLCKNMTGADITIIFIHGFPYWLKFVTGILVLSILSLLWTEVWTILIVRTLNHPLCCIGRRMVSTSDDKSIRVWEWNIPVDTKYVLMLVVYCSSSQHLTDAYLDT